MCTEKYVFSYSAYLYSLTEALHQYALVFNVFLLLNTQILNLSILLLVKFISYIYGSVQLRP